MEDSGKVLKQTLKHNKRLRKLLKKHQHYHTMQDALIQLSEYASTVAELSLLYPAIHQILEAYLPSKNFYVVLLNPESQLLELTYFIDEKDDIFIPLSEEDKFHHGLTGLVYKTGKTQFYTKQQILDAIAENKLQQNGTPSEFWLGTPIYKDQQIIGVMVTQSYYAHQSYSDSQIDLVETIALYLATAIERVKYRESLKQTVKQRTSALTQANQTLQAEIEQHKQTLKQQQILFDISELAIKTNGLNDFYHHLHQIIKSITYAENLYICLYDQDNNKLSFPYYVDSLNANYQDRDFALGFTEYIILQGRPQILTPDITRPLIAQGKIEPQFNNLFSTSWLGVPLISEHKIIGVVATQSYDNIYDYQQNDIELFTFVSQQIANVLQKHLAIKQLAQSHEQLEYRVKAKTQELQRTNHSLQQQIEERKKIEQQLYYDAHHDALTGLANRSLFVNELDKALKRHHRHPEPGFAVLFIDLDNFKQINDTFGHQTGDQFLTYIANSLNQCIRDHDLLARLGGDEFVILLTHINHQYEAQEVAERIIASLATPLNLDEKIIYSGASIGITCSKNNYHHSDEIMKDADTAMYQAKNNGRGHYVFFSPEHQQVVAKVPKIDCFDNNAVSFKSNSIINSNDQQHHVACFIERYWQHPHLGKIKFKQISQYLSAHINYHHCEVALIEQIIQYVGCQHDILISANIELLSPDYFELLTKQLMSLPQRQHVCLMFNENTLQYSNNQTKTHLLALKQYGIKIGIEDFAHTRCDLSILTQCQFDYIVLSPLFCQKLSQESSYRLQLSGIQATANATQSKLIAKAPTSGQYQAKLAELGLPLFFSQKGCTASEQELIS